MKIKSTTSVAVAIRPRPILHAGSVLLLLLITGSLIVGHYSESPWVKRIKYGFIETFSPVISLLSSPVNYMEDATARVKEIMTVHHENRILKEENTALLQWQTVASQLESENRELRSLLGLGAAARSHYIAANIVSDSHDPISHTLFIEFETSEKVRTGLPVMSAKGVIGHILETEDNHAKVLLITDRLSRLPVQNEENGSRAILAGTNQHGTMVLNHVSNPEEFTIGSRIVTTASELFPIRMAIGEVERIEHNTIYVKPYADTTRLRFVSIAIPADNQ